MTTEDDKALIDKVMAWKECLIKASEHEHDDTDECECLECICDDAIDRRITVYYNYGVMKYGHSVLTLGWGGPNIYYDTGNDTLEGFWGASHYVTEVPEEVGIIVDKWMENCFMDAQRERL